MPFPIKGKAEIPSPSPRSSPVKGEEDFEHPVPSGHPSTRGEKGRLKFFPFSPCGRRCRMRGKCLFPSRERRRYLHPHLSPLPSRERRILNTPSLRDTPLQEGKKGLKFFPSPLVGEG